MKLALVTTAAESSAVGAHAAALAPEFAARVELTLFVEPAAFAERSSAPRTFAGLAPRSAAELLPREFDQVLYTVGDEAQLAFVAPLVRALGGAVLLHDWALPNFARAAFPALSAGGLRGVVAAAREGGLAQARELRAGRPAALNRSIVRFGDAFLVHSAQLQAALLEERNAPTPIAVADGLGEGAARALELGAGRWPQIAEQYLALLQRFPRPRTARKSLIALQIAHALEARRSK
jgi:hypothetical protein